MEEAKKASKAAQIRKLAEDKPEMSRADIAREVGADRSAVTHALKEKEVTKKPSTPKPPQPTIKLAKNPALTAANIKAKMGEEYAEIPRGNVCSDPVISIDRAAELAGLTFCAGHDWSICTKTRRRLGF